MSYSYNADGIRVSKNVNDIRHEYYLDGSRIIKETWADQTLEFLYDENNSVYCIVYTGGDGAGRYYLIKNLQGDVTRILNNNLETVAQYVYDPWGKLVYILDADGEPNSGISIANINPIRYRGYYFDMETGFYYLNARYYDPALGRFVNPDSFVTTGQGLTSYNMYAYCGNNPVNRTDPDGQFWITAMIVAAVVTVSAAVFSGCSAQPTSDVGAAKPYVDMPGSNDATSPNCYAYAIGSPVNEQPGKTSGRIPTRWNDVNDVGESVEADLKAKGHTVRRISGPNAKVYDNEFKIALRVGTQPYAYNPYTGRRYYDYHFMRQTDTGQWAEKHGYGGASVLWDAGMTPDTIPWTLGGIPYYDSAIIYYAVGN